MVSETNRRFTCNADKIEMLVKCADNNKENASNPTTEKKGPRKKILIEVDEDDPCLQGRIPEDIKKETKETKETFVRTPGNDPRFQQQNQTLRCYVMYTDFYRCEHILGEGHEACTWFKQVFTSICPTEWVNNWDELRVKGRMPWHKHRTQGDFPGHSYGKD